MRVGLLTGGGDCPGLNAVIRAAVRRALVEPGHSVVGFRHGWAGVLADDAFELTLRSTAGILPRGGTILGTSRTNPFAEGGAPSPKGLVGTAAICETLRSRGVDALIPIGGEDTLGVALRLHEQGVPVVGVPKTIDNDLGGTDVTFGFQTAVQIVHGRDRPAAHDRRVAQPCDGARGDGPSRRLDRHARGHRRWSGCDPRARAPVRHRAGGRAPARQARARVELLDRGRRRGRDAARGHLHTREGAFTDAFGHPRLGGIGVALEGELERLTGYESRVTILGHVQRGGTPVAFDRVLATRFGVAAMDAAVGRRFGAMVGLRGTQIVQTPLADALREPKLLDPALYQTAELFFG